MKQIEKLQQAFSDCPPRSGLRVENARYYPKSFGNEEATLKYGSLEMHFLYDRGALYADILIPARSNSFINIGSLARRFGFVAQSSDAIANLREFFRQFEKRLQELGEALRRDEIPPQVADLIIDHRPGEVVEWKKAGHE